MTKTIRELAEEYKAVIDLEDCDEVGSGTLVKTFDFDTYMENHEEKPSGNVKIESVMEFKEGEPVNALYYVVVDGIYGPGNDDDLDGVLRLWTR